MRTTILALALISLFSFGCVTKHAGGFIPIGTTLGKVSHQYRATGCATVVIVKRDDSQQPITLIPRDTLSEIFDVDGLEIYFNYHPLKMRNPAGCKVGIPAELTDISKK